MHNKVEPRHSGWTCSTLERLFRLLLLDLDFNSLIIKLW